MGRVSSVLLVVPVPFPACEPEPRSFRVNTMANDWQIKYRFQCESKQLDHKMSRTSRCMLNAIVRKTT